MKNEKGITLVGLSVMILILVIIIGVGFFIHNKNLKSDNTVTNEINNLLLENVVDEENADRYEVQEISDIEGWRKSLWDYFAEYENYYAVRLEYGNGKDEIKENDFLIKKGFDIAFFQNKANEDGTVNKSVLDQIVLNYYEKTPESYDTDIYKYNEEKQTISIKEGKEYEMHGSSVLFLKEIVCYTNGDDCEYVADFESYSIPEDFDPNFDNGEYQEFLNFEVNNEIGETIVNLDYEKLYESFSKSTLKFQKYRERDIRIKFKYGEDGTYKFNSLYSTN